MAAIVRFPLLPRKVSASLALKKQRNLSNKLDQASQRNKITTYFCKNCMNLATQLFTVVFQALILPRIKQNIKWRGGFMICEEGS